MRLTGWWAELDSNQRRRKPADLQSAPFGHFGIYPFLGFPGAVGGSSAENWRQMVTGAGGKMQIAFFSGSSRGKDGAGLPLRVIPAFLKTRTKFVDDKCRPDKKRPVSWKGYRFFLADLGFFAAAAFLAAAGFLTTGMCSPRTRSASFCRSRMMSHFFPSTSTSATSGREL
jgi:hypothetical protein